MGGILGAVPLGAFVLGAAAAPAAVFNAGWAVNSNIVVQPGRIES